MKRKAYLMAIATLSTAAVIGSVSAANFEDNDALSITGVKIDLGAAVTTAEQHTGGKASRAEYERHDGHWLFDVEVVKGRAVIDVKVDAGNGKVIEARADKADHDDAGDRED